jgi:hypothetical protein
VGVNFTLKVQLAPARTCLPHVLVWVKAPVTETFVMLSFPRPVLVRVTVWAALVVKTTWLEKVRLVGENVTTGNTPTPLSGSD